MAEQLDRRAGHDRRHSFLHGLDRRKASDDYGDWLPSRVAKLIEDKVPDRVPGIKEDYDGGQDIGPMS